MKFWILGLVVCLFSTRELVAQYNGNLPDPLGTFQQQRLDAAIQALSTSRTVAPAISTVHQSDQDAVVSIQQLSHKTGKQARKLFDKGMREYFRMHYAEALLLLQKSAALDPQSATIQNNIGVIYCKQGKTREAQEAFQNAVALDLSSVVSYVNLSAVAFSTNQHLLAEASARRALRLAPLCAEAEVMLSLAQVAQDHWTTEARKFLEVNRSRFSQASLILQHWPTEEDLRSGFHRAISVRPAGPAALQ